ncbi:MAG TPA: DUF885 domain-containing protein [Pyrinomonadaceae bacterium]|jgi:uncharacterized protein (DUF885 family)|nr:DUF885 domain-containing protein [Pyrinomonadaceae bacterium]
MRRLLPLLFALLLSASACTTTTPQNANANSNAQAAGGGDAAFKTIHDRYVVEFLRRNPSVNTYLGGAGLDPSLKEVDGRLRDHSSAALADEDRWLEETRKAFEGTDASALSPARRIDRDVALAQISFLLHQHGARRYQERSLDTYTVEPFRSISFFTQGMTQTGAETYGTPEEWSFVVKRLQDFPRYMRVAQEQLAAGVKSGNTPDRRMLKRDGLDTCAADVDYYDKKFIEEANKLVAQGPQRDELVRQLTEASKGAAEAYRSLGGFIRATYFNPDLPADLSKVADVSQYVKSEFRGDKYALGEDEYNWALKNNLRVDKSAAQLYEEAWPVVQKTQGDMVRLAREVGAKRNLKLADDDMQAVRDVLEELGKDYPKTDAEEVAWYKEAAVRLVDYARKTGIFDVPADYKLEVVETPPPLKASIDGAAYYPAPPFKNTGVGRYYVTTSGNNDPATLKENNRAALADLSAHEGFPGHDWHYKVMTEARKDIAWVRWLTPGAVEDSSAMWEDSVAAEGWAHYSEALMAEPQGGAPEGFYTPEERLYQLKGQLYRDLRVRIDTGLHTGRITFDDAVDLFSQVTDFLPGKCSDANLSEAKVASCTGARSAIFRYSKWPTQAITYHLGKQQIYALRAEAAKLSGDKFSPKEFHLLFMRQGTIPSGYFREELLRALQKK